MAGRLLQGENVDDMTAVTQICQAIVDKKGMNIVTLDVRQVSSSVNFFVIAEGTVDRHVKAIAHNVESTLAAEHVLPKHVEGLREGEWIVLDYTDVVVHLFTPELRSYYSLEEVWNKGRIIQVPVRYASGA